MSDGAISQDEIDALLSGVDMGGLGSAGFPPSKSNEKQLNTAPLAEFSSEVASVLADSLTTMTGTTFTVGAPVVEQVNRDQLLRKIPEMIVGVTADFSEGLSGDHLFLLAPEFAQKLAGLINKEDSPELDDMALSVISEIVSQHSGSEITKLSQTGKFPGLNSNPAEAVHVPKAMVRYPSNNFILISYPVTTDGGVFTLWEAIAKDAASSIIGALGGGSDDLDLGGGLSAAEMQQMSGMAGGMGSKQGMNGMGMQGYPQGMNGMGNMQGYPQGYPQGMNGMGNMQGGMMGMNVPNVQALQYPNLQQGISSMEQGNIGLIMDVYMEMTVELGRTKKQIKEILGMGEGTIIELDKLAGEPVDILVNHKPIAKGEVVVIDENFGVRVTEILSPIERVSDLR
ncbi:MAG TPA: flagellar motor switch protein FliN [Treponemataceae bacterium]|nr:flagellar motor switch protein FliN [Treponemataceae bacterium]